GRLLLRSDVRQQLYAAMPVTERKRVAQSVLDPQSDPRALAFLAHARGQEAEALKRFAALAEELQRAGNTAGVDLLLTEAATLWHCPSNAGDIGHRAQPGGPHRELVPR